MRDSYGCFTSMLAVVGLILFYIGIMCFTNSRYDNIWNNGTCKECDIRFEMRGVSDGLKYYSCPECGQEVLRY